MMKNFVLFIVLFVLFVNMITVDSLDCYKCESVNRSLPECEDGLGYNVERGPCKVKGIEQNYCFKVNGTGIKSNKPTVIRGCWHQSIIPYVNYSLESPFVFNGLYGDYNVVGLLYTCDSNLCNSANDFKYSIFLLISLAMFANFKPRFDF